MFNRFRSGRTVCLLKLDCLRLCTREILSRIAKVDSDAFYGELSGDGIELRELLWPLASLSPRERAVFTEYHYWRTHMRVIAESHRISLGRTYEILYRAEGKIASSKSQAQKKDH